MPDLPDSTPSRSILERVRPRSRRLAILGGSPEVDGGGPVKWPVITRRAKERVVRALCSGRLSYGADSVCRDFEEAFAAYHAMPYAIATNSGTSALLLAYFACGIGPGSGGSPQDEVVVPSWGFFATVSPLVFLGARPVFCDVEPETGNLDPQRISDLITPRTRAIVVTHIAGHVARMQEIREIARRNGLSLIEDCSHAHGSRREGQLAGTFGDIAAFSLQTGKMVSAGEGGVMMTREPELLRRAAAYGNFRRLEGTSLTAASDLDETGLGLKLRLGPLSAALAHYHLDELDQMIAQRRQRLDRLTAILKQIDGVEPPTTASRVCRGAYYEYPVRIDRQILERISRERIQRALEAEGVQFRPSNTKNIAQLPLLRSRFADALGWLASTPSTPPAPLPVSSVSHDLGRRTLTFPTFTTEPLKLVDSYGRAVAKVLGQIDLLTAPKSGRIGL